MSRRIGLTLAGMIVVAASVGAIILGNPLRRSEAHIRVQLLHEKPLGSDFADVRAWLELRGWRNPRHQEQTGLYWQGPGQSPGSVGATSIASNLGHYRGLPWRVDVEAFWVFDDQGRLIEVKVRKSADAL